MFWSWEEPEIKESKGSGDEDVRESEYLSINKMLTNLDEVQTTDS
jgi:hypothetical protein